MLVNRWGLVCTYQGGRYWYWLSQTQNNVTYLRPCVVAVIAATVLTAIKRRDALTVLPQEETSSPTPPTYGPTRIPLLAIPPPSTGESQHVYLYEFLTDFNLNFRSVKLPSFYIKIPSRIGIQLTPSVLLCSVYL